MRPTATKRETTVPTRRRNQIDIDLNKVQDQYAREALAQLLHVINDLVGKGLETQGTVVARGGIASGESDDSRVTMERVAIGVLPANTGAEDHYCSVKVPGRIVSVAGWCQALGAKDDWRALSRAAVTGTIYLNQLMGADEKTIYLFNADTGNANSYRCVIKYVPDTINREVGVTDA